MIRAASTEIRGIDTRANLKEGNMRKGTSTKWFGLFAGLALVALSLGAAACSGDDDDKSSGGSTAAVKGFTDAGYKKAGFKTYTIEKDAPIKIGISSALSGDVKGLGLPIADAAAVAGEGVTIKGHKIEFVREDDLCSPEGGPAAGDRLIKANVVGVVGPICSGGTRASLAAYDAAGLTHISPSATAGDLTSPTRAEGPFVTFFRVPVLNADEAREQANFAADVLKAKKAFVVFDSDDYGKDLAAEFQTSFKAKGGTIVGQPQSYEKKQCDFNAVVANIKAAKPDVIYQSGFYAEATCLLQALRKDSDTKGIAYIGGDGIKNDELLTGAKDAAEGAYLALPGTQGTEFANFAKKYATFTKGKESDAESATFGAEAYDAATALIKAIEKVAKDDGGKLTIDGKALNDAVLKSDFAGASGQVKFLANGNRAGAVVRLFKVTGGKYVQLKTGEK